MMQHISKMQKLLELHLRCALEDDHEFPPSITALECLSVTSQASILNLPTSLISFDSFTPHLQTLLDRCSSLNTLNQYSLTNHPPQFLDSMSRLTRLTTGSSFFDQPISIPLLMDLTVHGMTESEAEFIRQSTQLQSLSIFQKVYEQKYMETILQKLTSLKQLRIPW